MCILRRFLCKYMEAKKIDKHVYHDMYLRHVFKNKRVLMESIHRSKAEKAIEKTLFDQSKNKANRGRKHAGLMLFSVRQVVKNADIWISSLSMLVIEQVRVRGRVPENLGCLPSTWRQRRLTHVYHDMYLRHVFKKKRVLMESIHKSKAEKAIERTLSDQSKNKASRGRKHVGWEEPLNARNKYMGCFREILGASSGIVFETARVLAMLGVRVVMGVWNIAAGKDVKKTIPKENSSDKVDVMELYLRSMASVIQFASKFESVDLPLNLLINNVEVMACPFMLSHDNIETKHQPAARHWYPITWAILKKVKFQPSLVAMEFESNLKETTSDDTNHLFTGKSYSSSQLHATTGS
ncbi:hypothetical protein C5167_011317 [Papaver somniferum]|uniref:Uncharacterized protein n=1 Tax=Papaver somniferum TaxID=3469 RepID=A0A4Y7K2N9_PAPSO|nr:hypothetical protein C5167_011317 [Papaver somniferum]